MYERVTLAKASGEGFEINTSWSKEGVLEAGEPAGGGAGEKECIGRAGDDRGADPCGMQLCGQTAGGLFVGRDSSGTLQGKNGDFLRPYAGRSVPFRDPTAASVHRSIPSQPCQGGGKLGMRNEE